MCSVASLSESNRQKWQSLAEARVLWKVRISLNWKCLRFVKVALTVVLPFGFGSDPLIALEAKLSKAILAL